MGETPKPAKKATRKAVKKTTKKTTAKAKSSTSKAVAKTTTRKTAGAKTRKPARKSPAVQPARPSYEQIRDRAYFIYLERGCTHGCDMQDWLQAESELVQA